MSIDDLMSDLGLDVKVIGPKDTPESPEVTIDALRGASAMFEGVRAYANERIKGELTVAQRKLLSNSVLNVINAIELIRRLQQEGEVVRVQDSTDS